MLAREVSPLLASPVRDLRADDVTPWLERRFREFFAERAQVQGTATFLHKFTGWPRAGFIRGVLPDARFIHVVRDGRAVANSWLQMPWWLGFEGPDHWQWGPLPPDLAAEWEEVRPLVRGARRPALEDAHRRVRDRSRGDSDRRLARGPLRGCRCETSRILCGDAQILRAPLGRGVRARASAGTRSPRRGQTPFAAISKPLMWIGSAGCWRASSLREATTESVGAAPGDQRRDRLGEDVEVHGHRPVLHVEEVVAHVVLEDQVVASVDLPEPGHTRLDAQAAAL